MRHTVKLQGITVGWSDLEDAEPSVGRARGVFRPGIGYDLVQPVFQLFRDAVPARGGAVADEELLARYHRSRDALQLTLEDGAGVAIATTAIHIADYASGASAAARELEVLIADDGYWRRRNAGA
ncbi:MAG: hypothetical protein JWO05_2681 [Gemmatimonadetes bacterium]|nr:hypothetical protein [Gemmatimonadota bacterium]